MGSWYHIKAICLENITWTQLEKQNVQVKRLIQAQQILKVTFFEFFFCAIVFHACMSDQIRSDKNGLFVYLLLGRQKCYGLKYHKFNDRYVLKPLNPKIKI